MSRHKLSLNVFKGCTIFVQSKGYEDRTLAMNLIKENGGWIEYDPLAPTITHVIVHIPLFKPRGCCYQYTVPREVQEPRSRYDWGVDALLQEYTMQKPRSSDNPVVVVERGWLQACINSRTLLGAAHIEGAFGGWQVRGVHKETTAAGPSRHPWKKLPFTLTRPVLQTHVSAPATTTLQSAANADEAVQRVDPLLIRRSSLPPLGTNSSSLVVRARPTPLPVHEEEPGDKSPKATLLDLFTPEPEEEPPQSDNEISPAVISAPRPTNPPVHEAMPNLKSPKPTLTDLFTPEPEGEQPQSDSDLSPAPTTPASPTFPSTSSTPLAAQLMARTHQGEEAEPAEPESPAVRLGPQGHPNRGHDAEDKVNTSNARNEEDNDELVDLNWEDDDELERLYDEEDKLNAVGDEPKVDTNDNLPQRIFWPSEQLPVKFYLEGTSNGVKTLIEKFGGEIVSKESATLCILPLDSGVRATETAHRDIVERKGTHALSQAVSHDYIWSCIKNSALMPTDKFLVKLPAKRSRVA